LTDTGSEALGWGKEKKTMPGPYKKPYDEGFKRNAVELLIRSGKPLRVVARELGVSDTVLRNWKVKQLGETETARSPRGEGGATPRDMSEEIVRLRKELDRVTRQRDILKKAMGICSETSPGGMP
jgi:transposase